MIKTFDSKLYLGFFENELTNRLLAFWLPRCIDKENGGYLNCFSNDGSRLISTDKYTWSQGRFLWMFSKLATMESNLFDNHQRKEFLSLAKIGHDFLMKHVLIAPNDWRCVFLMEADGKPKYVAGYKELDMSISADCFVVMGFAKYATASEDNESWQFAKALGQSVWERYHSGNYRSLPYPLSPAYRGHAKPMILTNVCCELYEAAQKFEPSYASLLKEYIRQCSEEVFNVFMDKNHLIHEFKYANGDFPGNLFGQHINPGHTLEDMWFQAQAQAILESNRYNQELEQVTLATLRKGWDETYGGFYHFITCEGKEITSKESTVDEPQMKLVLDDWGSKLWWVHSEALYTSLLMYDRTNNTEYLNWFEKIFDYTYTTFPNPDPEIREWIQIRTREGTPQDKVVALPVKDPYHIVRNVTLIIELLERRLRRENSK